MAADVARREDVGALHRAARHPWMTAGVMAAAGLAHSVLLREPRRPSDW